MRILGVDYGLSKVGLAIADTDTGIASPLVVLKNNDRLFDELKKIVKDEDIDQIIVGIPGGEGFEASEQKRLAEEFILELDDNFSVHVEGFDESYTTTEAQKLMQENDLAGEDDDLAAMVMLQAYLDTKSRKA